MYKDHALHMCTIGNVNTHAHGRLVRKKRAPYFFVWENTSVTAWYEIAQLYPTHNRHVEYVSRRATKDVLMHIRIQHLSLIN